MEERRQAGGRLLKAGKLSQAEIARQLCVRRATVSDLAKVIESQGIKGLKSKKAKGVEAKLGEEQKQRQKNPGLRCVMTRIFNRSLDTGTHPTSDAGKIQSQLPSYGV